MLGPAILAFIAIEATRTGLLSTQDSGLKAIPLTNDIFWWVTNLGHFFQGLDECSSDHKLCSALVNSGGESRLLRDKDGIAQMLSPFGLSWRLSRYAAFLALDSVDRQLGFLRRILLYPNATELIQNMQRTLRKTTDASTISYFSMLLISKRNIPLIDLPRSHFALGPTSP